MQDLTHVLFALALAYVCGLPVVYAIIGALLPDVDVWIQVWLPATHYGVMHTPIFAATSTIGVYLVSNRRQVAAAFLAGIVSHLALDALTVDGIMWMYPVVLDRFALGVIDATGPVPNIVLSLSFVGIMAVWRYRQVMKTWRPTPAKRLKERAR